MLDAKRLLDAFIGGHAADPGLRGPASNPGVGSAIGELARQFGGRTSGAARTGKTQGGIGDMLGGLSNETLMGAGGLAAILLGAKGGRKLGGSALKMGGMAVIGSLAYKAYQDWQAGKQAEPASAGNTTPLPPPSGTPFNPASEGDQQALSLKLLRAMIAGAKADGHIDAAEQARIFTQMDTLDLDQDAKAFVVDELRAPLDVEAIAGSAGSPEEAAEIYAASLLAIDVDNPAERGYLTLLAARLKLDDALVAHLQSRVRGAAEKAAGP